MHIKAAKSVCKPQTESCQTVFRKQMPIWDNEQQKLLEKIKAVYF